MDEKRYNAGIDIGGTKVKVGIVSENGSVLTSRKIRSVSPDETLEGFISRILETLFSLMRGQSIDLREIRHIGVGIPGTVNMKTGVVEYCPNLGWDHVRLKEALEEKLSGAEIGIIQDSWAAAVAEHEFGAGRECDNLACVTLGTGIGCGVILGGRLFSGGMHCAGELGHTIVQKGGIHCSCGRDGCLERYASGNGIFDQAWQLFPEKFAGREKKAETVFDLAHEGYEPALELIDHSVQMLAVGLSNMIDILSVEKVLVSGGLCEHDNLIIEPLKKYVYKYGYHAWTSQNIFRLEKASVGEDAPMLGAAFMYRAVG